MPIRVARPRSPNPRFHTVHALLALFVLINLVGLFVVASHIEPGLQGERGRTGAAGGGGGGGGSPGADGYTALVVQSSEPAGPNCDVSGEQFDSGLDNGDGGGVSRNGILEAGEIDFTGYACDGLVGSNGFNSLIKTTAESPGANCANGGRKVESGIDNGDGGGTPGNSILEAGEVDATTYVCNGAPGATGAQGYAALVKTTAESPGVNCANGGQKVEVGIDNGDGGGTAGNFILEAGEIDQTSYVCNGAAGAAGTNGFNALVTSSAEAAGANCANAGRKIQAGTDNGDGGGTAGNGILEAGEVDTTGYACNGADAGLLYTYNTGTSGDPGSGKFGFDTTTLTAIATLRISETDGDGNGIAALLATWDDSTSSVRSIIRVVGNGAPTRLLVFTITGAMTDNGAYDSFPVAHIANGGSHANNDIDRLHQARTGDKGDAGAAGADGTDGNGFTVVDSLTSAFTSTSTTGAEVTGLTNSLSAGIYVATFYLICRTAAVGTGIDFGINFDSTQDVIVSQLSYQDTGTTASTGLADGTVTGDGGELIIGGGSVITETTTAPNLNVITGVGGASEDFMVIIKVIFKPTATGELELWVATDVAASQVDVRIGSSVTIIKTG